MNSAYAPYISTKLTLGWDPSFRLVVVDIPVPALGLRRNNCLMPNLDEGIGTDDATTPRRTTDEVTIMKEGRDGG